MAFIPDDERVHIFAGDPRWFQERHALEWAAQQITRETM